MQTFNETREGVKTVCGVVTQDDPVKFHDHNLGHRLICCGPNLLAVKTEKLGDVHLVPGQTLWVEAKDNHELTAPSGPSSYCCCGLEGF